MKFDEYQTAAHAMAFHPEMGVAIYPALGLAGETGEVVDKVKKLHRDLGGRPTSAFRAAVALELGDVLWYLSELAGELGLSLDDVATANLAKLESRKRRGTLGGSGDNR
jgi:NTP pyrophosphatase (non-canonical NTP hydrolase)